MCRHQSNSIEVHEANTNGRSSGEMHEATVTIGDFAMLQMRNRDLAGKIALVKQINLRTSENMFFSNSHGTYQERASSDHKTHFNISDKTEIKDCSQAAVELNKKLETKCSWKTIN